MRCIARDTDVATRTGTPLHFLFEATTMLKLALILFVVSLIAAALGFTGIAGAAAGLAKIIFIIAIALFLIVLVLALLGIQLFT